VYLIFILPYFGQISAHPCVKKTLVLRSFTGLSRASNLSLNNFTSFTPSFFIRAKHPQGILLSNTS